MGMMPSFINLHGHTFVNPQGQAPVIIDCGANRGEFSAASLKQWPAARIYAIEPNPELHSDLEKIPVLHLYRCALDVKESSIRFNVSKNPEASSAMWTVDGVSAIDVPAIRLGSVIEQAGGKIDLVKMDIEGSELAVLLGLEDRYLVGISQISVEFHDFIRPETLPEIKAVHRRLRKAGFSRVNHSWPRRIDVLYYRQERVHASGLEAALVPPRNIIKRLERSFKALARR